MIDEEFDAIYIYTNSPTPIGTKIIEIDYFNVAKDQLGRIVILRLVWKYYLSQEQQLRHVYLFYYEYYQAACLNHNSMKLEELAWVLLLLICKMVL
jgi:hypothetical protein